MKFFVAGANGMLASDLIPLLEEKGEILSGDLPDFDITDKKAIDNYLRKVKPDVVINCAAYTAVDRAEEEKETAYAVNGRGAGNLAEVCGKIKARLIHISTDFVFDGEKNRPYEEKDATNPISVYGSSKLEGERIIQEIMSDYVIIRTSWLYGQHGNNFVETVARLASEREDLGIVFDQIGSPTYAKDLSRAIINLISAEPGIYNFSNEGVCSWYDFACEIIALLKEKGGSLTLKNLRPIRTEEYPTPARRPPYSVLDKSKYKKTTSKSIPHWRDGLIRYFEK